MKKLMALALAVVMVLSLGVTAIAEEKPTLELVAAEFTAKGQEKEVKVVAKNFSRITAFEFAFEYDATKLEVVTEVVVDEYGDEAVVPKVAVKGNLSEPIINANIPGKIYINWDSLKAADINGDLVVITFRAISDELGETGFGFLDGTDVIFSNADYVEIPADDIEVPEEDAKIEIEYEHEHAWTEWKEVELASCEGKGLEERHCTAYNGTCDASETRPVEALGHDWDNGAVQDAKCDETADIIYTCQRCQETKTETGAKVEHDFGEWTKTVVPGCETKGEERRDCERAGCDHYETRPVAALGHDWDEGTVQNAKCGETADILYTCQRCQEEYTETGVVVEHAYGEWYETVAPGCETKGEERHDCERDGCEHYETRPVDALGHDWDDGVITTEPGCESTGVKTFTCQRCQDTYTKVVDALGHTWDEGEVTLEPTCTTDGNRLHKCTVEGCTGEYNNPIAALGHDMGKWVVVKEATGMEDGLERRECSRCDHYEERVIKNIMFLDPTVIIDMNGKTEAETNPNTGAPVMGAYAVVALAAAASFFKKNHK